jgi:hypothetical protein
MPKTETETPATLRPYEFLGLNLSYRKGDKDAYAECIFCGKDNNKFGIKIETGQFRCNVCEEKGNIRVFIKKLHEISYEATTTAEYKELAANRQLYTDETLVHWWLAKSVLTGDWLCPGWNQEGKLTSLYRYLKNNDRMILMPCPTLGHHLFGMHLFDKAKPITYLCEGLWDGACLWETLRVAKHSDNGFAVTSNPSASLLAEANVLAIPTANSFKEEWCELFGGKIVHLMTQNDHPRKHPKTSKAIAPASQIWMMKHLQMMYNSEWPPESIDMIFWGPNNTHNPELKSGYDVRDYINA